MQAFSSLTGLGFMLALGLRHGVDPDHIAMIDGMAYRLVPTRPRLAAWVGTLFALGHGLAVTVIAVALGAFAGRLAVPPAVHAVLDWLPTALLLLVGTLNLHGLLVSAGAQPYHLRGWKHHLMPRRLREGADPLSIVLVGVVFALVFDTATQAAAWGYAATAGGGTRLALLAGLAFTAGMVATDSVDGRLMVRLLRRAHGDGRAAAYRRAVGWGVVLMSYGMAACAIAGALVPGAGLDDATLSALGAASFGAAVLACVLGRRRTRADAPSTRPAP